MRRGCKANPVLSTGPELVRGDSWRPEAGEKAQTGSRDDSRWPYPVTFQKLSKQGQLDDNMNFQARIDGTASYQWTGQMSLLFISHHPCLPNERVGSFINGPSRLAQQEQRNQTVTKGGFVSSV